MKALTMSDPASSAVGGFALWKALTAAAAGGSVLATVVVMVMTRPRTGPEWVVGLISTVVGSLAGGAYAAIKIGLVADIKAAPDDASLLLAVLSVIGLAFTCGLPAWSVVRWGFNWLERRKDKDLGEIVQEGKALL